MVEEIVFDPEKALELKRVQLNSMNAGSGSGISLTKPDSAMRARGGLIDRLTASEDGSAPCSPTSAFLSLYLSLCTVYLLLPICFRHFVVVPISYLLFYT